MFGGSITGLFTKKGYIYIHDLPNITNDLIEKYNDWHNKNNFFVEKTWNNEEIDIEELINCNNIGLEIIHLLKKILPDNIKVQFNYIIPKDYKEKKARNIRELII